MNNEMLQPINPFMNTSSVSPAKTATSGYYKPVATAKVCNALPIGYQLTENDVCCGRGKNSVRHVGNCRFRNIILANLDRYNTATTRREKSSIIYEVVDYVRCLCHTSDNGIGFVKRDKVTGHYYEVGDIIAREKVSQAFRDANSGKQSFGRLFSAKFVDKFPKHSFSNDESTSASCTYSYDIDIHNELPSTEIIARPTTPCEHIVVKCAMKVEQNDDIYVQYLTTPLSIDNTVIRPDFIDDSSYKYPVNELDEKYTFNSVATYNKKNSNLEDVLNEQANTTISSQCGEEWIFRLLMNYSPPEKITTLDEFNLEPRPFAVDGHHL